MKINLRADETFVLRTCCSDGRSYNNFKWPKRGPVKCPDWDPAPECGNGLHGALLGNGDGTLFNWSKNALWQIVKVKKSEIVDLGGKVKFPRGYVLFTGNQKEATNILIENGYQSIIGCDIKVGDLRNALAGFLGRAEVGNEGIAVAKCGTSVSGCLGVSFASGSGSHAISGDNGFSFVKSGGFAKTGKLGRAIAGNGGSAQADFGGIIQIDYYDNYGKLCVLVGYIGEDGLLPNVRYRVRNGKFVIAN